MNCPIEEVAGAVEDDVEGEVNAGEAPKRTRRRSGVPTRFSLLPPSKANTRCSRREPGGTVDPTLEELGIGFVPFGPLPKASWQRFDRCKVGWYRLPVSVRFAPRESQSESSLR